jgi:hypothetical protein
MKLWVSPGFPAAIPLTVTTAILGAVQLATVLATPLPKAARGKLIHGPSHAAGGTLIEAEGGEAIINRRSTSAYKELLSLINQAGGGIPFVRPGSDGGFSLRTMRRDYNQEYPGTVIYENANPGITGNEMKEAIADAIKDMKIYTTIEDIRRGEKRYSEINDAYTY